MAGSGGTSLEYTPTWALATVCFFFIFISLFLEHSIHLIVKFLKGRRKIALTDAVEKLKSELMLMGFVSLLLTVTQNYIAKICIPAKLGDIMLPCRKRDEEEDAADSDCSDGKVAFMTKDALQQLHILIFVLAVTHILYSVLTMALGRAKMRRWEAWEHETRTMEYQVENDPNRFRFTRQTTFGRRHMNSCTETSSLLWVKCFFRQFYKSVAKVDYITMRHGFIAVHLPSRQNSFDFRKYIQRSLEEDFKIMVSINPLMWFAVAALLLVDVYGLRVYVWISYVPLLVVLVLGTKLEHIVAKMALQIKEQNNVIIGTPLVRLNDDLFWFKKPRFVLKLLHYTLFVNAFELAFFVWVTIEFGFNSCYHEDTVTVIIRISFAVTAQVLCSYITLPLYALVTQMGSQFKGKIIEDNMEDILKQWHGEVRNRRKKEQQLLLQSPRTSFSTEWSSVRNSLSEVPSHVRRVLKPAESSVQDGIEEEEASSSRGYRSNVVDQ